MHQSRDFSKFLCYFTSISDSSSAINANFEICRRQHWIESLARMCLIPHRPYRWLTCIWLLCLQFCSVTHSRAILDELGSDQLNLLQPLMFTVPPIAATPSSSPLKGDVQTAPNRTGPWPDVEIGPGPLRRPSGGRIVRVHPYPHVRYECDDEEHVLYLPDCQEAIQRGITPSSLVYKFGNRTSNRPVDVPLPFRWISCTYCRSSAIL